jgi:hypothetical protein
MKKILVLLIVLLVVNSEGITFDELQKDLVKHFSSPFVGLMFVYDSAT